MARGRDLLGTIRVVLRVLVVLRFVDLQIQIDLIDRIARDHEILIFVSVRHPLARGPCLEKVYA